MPARSGVVLDDLLDPPGRVRLPVARFEQVDVLRVGCQVRLEHEPERPLSCARLCRRSRRPRSRDGAGGSAGRWSSVPSRASVAGRRQSGSPARFLAPLERSVRADGSSGRSCDGRRPTAPLIDFCASVCSCEMGPFGWLKCYVAGRNSARELRSLAMVRNCIAGTRFARNGREVCGPNCDPRGPIRFPVCLLESA